MKQTKTKPIKKKKSKEEIIKDLKEGFKKVVDAWNDALNQLEKFEPMKDMKFPDFETQMKDFNIGGDCKI